MYAEFCRSWRSFSGFGKVCGAKGICPLMVIHFAWRDESSDFAILSLQNFRFEDN